MSCEMYVRGIDLEPIANVYRIKGTSVRTAFIELIEDVCMEYDPESQPPNLADDPIPRMREMARTLHNLCQNNRELRRMRAAAQTFHGHNFTTSAEYVDEMTVPLGSLSRLLDDVPVNAGGKPRDLIEYLAVRKLCEFWKSLDGERKLSAKFYKENEGGEAETEGGRFVCDIIECVLAQNRPFGAGMKDPDDHAVNCRKSLRTQIRRYVEEFPSVAEQQ